jgi:hypothetical protein
MNAYFHLIFICAEGWMHHGCLKRYDKSEGPRRIEIITQTVFLLHVYMIIISYSNTLVTEGTMVYDYYLYIYI